ncbi:MAG: glycosyltransferase family 2 protein [Betaproteobacteria bacterium]|nr:glycosyltransferase family 2 protein [Betaproteobacteria bacterium]
MSTTHVGSAGPTARAALVTTLRGAAPVLDSFIRYHLARGFAHLYLFFDDPDDPALALARRHEGCGVTILARGPGLDAAWRQCVQFAYFAPHLESEVMSRQCLNVEVAVQLALAAGHDWLLHIDADELFDCPGQDAGAHFARLAAQGFDRAVYPNLEALPETADVADFFREVTLFKTNRNTLPGGMFSPGQAALAARHSQFPPAFFLFYSNGKSAARVRPGLVPDGVHRFRAGSYLRPGQAPAPTAGPGRECIVGDCRILHYACCGYANFRDKYRILGAFADRWFGRVDIRGSIGDFHLRARDIVAGGDEERARAFYRQRAMLGDPDAVRELIAAGILQRIDGPAQWLTGDTETPP